ncbi:MAG TPA: pseudaminic acid biosynthesis-associated methylase [Coriobacteriia bacterium]|nr:pseudaminic acid biosynthesis-associated methylase [Coriobacteriia bacterium]
MGSFTEQEAFWAGEFGDAYVDRNQGARLAATNLAFWGVVLARTQGLGSVLELGSNIGLNLVAIRHLLPDARLSAVEINEKAASLLSVNVPGVDLHRESILDFAPRAEWDLVFTRGVLIHIAPDRLPSVYELMHRSSSRYLLVSEYYNPAPVEIPYRGHSDKLFKRDFAGEMLDAFPDLALVDYGFGYHRDPSFPQDDATWFLMEKR